MLPRKSNGPLVLEPQSERGLLFQGRVTGTNRFCQIFGKHNLPETNKTKEGEIVMILKYQNVSDFQVVFETFSILNYKTFLKVAISAKTTLSGKITTK